MAVPQQPLKVSPQQAVLMFILVQLLVIIQVEVLQL